MMCAYIKCNMGNVDSTNSANSFDNKKQKIGEKLFAVVQGLHPDGADKITGMLMEMENSALEMLLSDRIELENKVKDAVEFLKGQEDVTDNEFQSAGDTLYDFVMDIYPTSADKITGMLLEMGTENIKQLMKDKEALMACINQAVLVLASGPKDNSQPHTESTKVLDNSQMKHNNNRESATMEISSMSEADTSEADQKQVLGEELYLIIEKLYPDKADRITGMLLDMDTISLMQLLQNHDLLKQKAQEAADVLEKVKAEEISTKETRQSDVQDEDEKILLGENLYQLIEQIYPDNAAKITGMLLEMNSEAIKEMLNNKSILQKKAKAAHEALT